MTIIIVIKSVVCKQMQRLLVKLRCLTKKKNCKVRSGHIYIYDTKYCGLI